MLKVFENWVLRRIFGPRREEVIKEWRKIYNELTTSTTHQILFGLSNRGE
jgi:hypothetical protein